MTNLSPHFTLEELTLSQTAARMGHPNTPPQNSKQYKNLKRLADTMEKVRSILGNNPIMTSSGYRAPAVNERVGGSKTSKHMEGLAIDFTCPGFGTVIATCLEIEPHIKELKIDQLIYEYNSWVHLGLTEGTPRHQAFTIDTKGTHEGIP